MCAHLRCHIANARTGGYVATCFSPKLVLGAGVVFWSLFTIATPFTAGNLPMLLATRAAMGIGEGVTFPAIQNLFAKCGLAAPLGLALWHSD